MTAPHGSNFVPKHVQCCKTVIVLAYSVSTPNKHTHVTLTCSEWRDRYFIVPPALFENGFIGSARNWSKMVLLAALSTRQRVSEIVCCMGWVIISYYCLCYVIVMLRAYQCTQRLFVCLDVYIITCLGLFTCRLTWLCNIGTVDNHYYCYTPLSKPTISHSSW